MGLREGMALEVLDLLQVLGWRLGRIFKHEGFKKACKKHSRNRSLELLRSESLERLATHQ